jgi:hypothetical protein
MATDIGLKKHLAWKTALEVALVKGLEDHLVKSQAMDLEQLESEVSLEMDWELMSRLDLPIRQGRRPRTANDGTRTLESEGVRVVCKVDIHRQMDIITMRF